MQLLGHRSVVLVIFYTKDGEILLAKRLSEPFNAHYDPPSGKVEPDELLMDAIQREVREETGIDIDMEELAKKIKLVFSITGLSTKEYIFSDIFLNVDYYQLSHRVYIYPFSEEWAPERTGIEKHEEWNFYSKKESRSLRLSRCGCVRLVSGQIPPTVAHVDPGMYLSQQVQWKVVIYGFKNKIIEELKDDFEINEHFDSKNISNDRNKDIMISKEDIEVLVTCKFRPSKNIRFNDVERTLQLAELGIILTHMFDIKHKLKFYIEKANYEKELDVLEDIEKDEKIYLYIYE
ncbi:3936_t:CDS:2 [Gigaspora rosea]|nr:3936_t:CDS:2 [Gigaspora rosea]